LRKLQGKTINFEIFERWRAKSVGLDLQLAGKSEKASPPVSRRRASACPRSAIEFMMELTDHNKSSISRPPCSGVV
jgi:hypothetical protein